MSKKLIKTGDRTIIRKRLGQFDEVRNRVNSEEAVFAMAMIERWGLGVGRHEGLMKPEEAVERAFSIARLTFQHIKDNRMDAPFPFSKVFPDDKQED